MMTYDLFAEQGNPSSNKTEIEMPNADVCFYSTLFSHDEAEKFFESLKKTIAWKQEQISFYGKVHDIPRLTAWHGNANKIYTYSGIKVQSIPWTPILLQIKERIENVSQLTFNSVLLNLYRSGKDGVSWHSDDEPELGKNPPIGSVSFGATRVFQLKHKNLNNEKREIQLSSGSYLLMKGETQHHWLHQIPKRRNLTEERINLTFRIIT